MMRSMKWIFVGLLSLPLSGCASMSDFHYEHTQRSRAKTAWRDHGSNCKPADFASDYKSGWQDGFYDIATGGKGCPPVVAPCCYWDPSQILEDCDRRRQAYYSGFQDGVACGLRYPQTHYLRLWSSCECPLPTCANQCGQTTACPCGSSGLNSFGSEQLIEANTFSEPSSVEPLPMPIDTDLAAPTASLPAPSPSTESDQTISVPTDEQATPVGSGAATPSPTDDLAPPADNPVNEVQVPDSPQTGSVKREKASVRFAEPPTLSEKRSSLLSPATPIVVPDGPSYETAFQMIEIDAAVNQCTHTEAED